MSKKSAPVHPDPATVTASPAIKVGKLAPGSAVGALLVELADPAGEPLPARSLVRLDDATIRQAVLSRQPVVLLFENQDGALPIVAGLLPAEPGAALLGSLLQAPAAALAVPTTRRLEARLDGKRVVLEGEHEVVLRCGEASITLRRDGKVILRGAYIETTAKGLNRIRGGSVKIN
jgi:hypothetical protein